LTGPVGGGSTWAAGHIHANFGFPIFSLSKYVHEKCLELGLPENVESLQDVGNDLRAKFGRNHLAVRCIQDINTSTSNSDTVIIDSIRNVGEINYFRRFPRFFCIAIDAPKNTRKYRKSNVPDFDSYDARDSEEDFSHGQQVRQCMYSSDIIIDNRKQLEAKSDLEDEFVRNYLLPNINLILSPKSKLPRSDETMMTLAYAQSLRSQCLKRSVGAVIATDDGDVVSTGHNDVPSSMDSCKRLYGRCYKDKVRVAKLRDIERCPKCGSDLAISVVCPKCDNSYSHFDIVCSKDGCGTELNASIKCSNPECAIDIIDKFDVKDLSRCRSLHAEENAIIKLTRFGGGVPLRNASIYVTTFPCNQCANKITQVGINRVVYVEPYPDKESLQILKDGGVKIQPFYGVKSHAYFRLYGGM